MKRTRWEREKRRARRDSYEESREEREEKKDWGEVQYSSDQVSLNETNLIVIFNEEIQIRSILVGVNEEEKSS